MRCRDCQQADYEVLDELLTTVVVAGLVVAGLVWLTGQVAGLLFAGTWLPVPPQDLPGILRRLPKHLGDPAQAWPATVRQLLPGPVGMYTAFLAPFVVPLLLRLAELALLGAWRSGRGSRAADPLAGRPPLPRPPHSPGGWPR